MNKAPWILLCIASVAAVPFACGGSKSSTSSGQGGAATTATTTGTTTVTVGSTSASTGSGGQMSLAACDAPEVAPSNGCCYAQVSSPTCTGTTTSTTSGGASSSGSGGGGGGPATTTSTTTTSAASGSTSSGGNACSGLLVDGVCPDCIEQWCCSQLTACQADSDCYGCLTGSILDTGTCGSAAVLSLLNPVNNCTQAQCETQCQSVPCNPITNQGCNTAAGDACDYSGDGFVCFPSGNNTPICQPCDNDTGPFCEPGLHCMSSGYCARYCCSNADCGSGVCDMTQIPGVSNVGLCVLVTSGSGSSASTGH